jgi:hypothetical protein
MRRPFTNPDPEIGAVRQAAEASFLAYWSAGGATRAHDRHAQAREAVAVGAAARHGHGQRERGAIDEGPRAARYGPSVASTRTPSMADRLGTVCSVRARVCIICLWLRTFERTSQFHELLTNGSEQQRANEGRVKAALSPIWLMRDWLLRRIRWIGSWHTPA